MMSWCSSRYPDAWEHMEPSQGRDRLRMRTKYGRPWYAVLGRSDIGMGPALRRCDLPGAMHTEPLPSLVSKAANNPRSMSLLPW
jgi:hypothetical protein